MNEDCKKECQAILLKNASENSPLNHNSFPELTVSQEIHSNYVENEEIYSEHSEVSSSDANCQTAESEVTDLKEWLILHNDLILQQNKEILEKDDQIYLLQRENEMLKERLLCLEKGIPYEPKQHLKIELSPETEEDTIEDLLSEDMTQDSCGQYEDDSKENPDQDTQQSDNVVTCSLEVNNFQVHHNNDDESQVDTTIDEEDFIEVEVEQFNGEEDYLGNNLSETDSDTAEGTKDSFPEYNFTVNNFCEFDSMKNIKMSIKRKRVSSLSALTNNEPSLLEEKKTLRRAKKKRKRSVKDLEILIAKEPYFVYNSNEEAYADPEPVPETAGLEVPRWRLKHYTSCYTMEGTENLDDEVFNKRHMRLEIDERRRKRWDVQRIREQRVIDKLKLRQDRINNGSKGETDQDQDSLGSLLPKMEDVKFLEVVDELPVCSFGHLIPKSEHTNFSLPWLDNPSTNTRRSNGKRSSSSRRRKRLRSTR